MDEFGAITKHIQQLERDERRLEGDEQRLIREREVVARKLQETRHKLEALRAVLVDLSPSPDLFKTEKPESLDAVPAGPADLICELLTQHKGGLAQRDIVSGLESKLPSRVPDKRRVLYNALVDLIQSGAVSVVTDSGEERCVLKPKKRQRQGN